jgi:hypothetical protein
VTPRRLSAAQIMARLIPEQQFMQDVIEHAFLMGWKLIYHVPDSRRASSAGFPDLVMVRRGRLLFLELKKVGGVVSPAQRAWLDALGEVPGVEVMVVTPEDWPALEVLLR